MRTVFMRLDPVCTLLVFPVRADGHATYHHGTLGAEWLGIEANVEVLDGPDVPDQTIALLHALHPGSPAGLVHWQQAFRPEDEVREAIRANGMNLYGMTEAERKTVKVNAIHLTEVQDLAKQKPGELNYATSSTGGPTHLGPLYFEMLAGIKMQQVPYKGGGPAMTDLVGGQVQLAFANPSGAVPMVKSGRLRGIAITGDKRLEVLPQLPTFTESGLPGLVLRNWYAIAAPANPPKTVVDKLSAATQKISAMPDVRAAISRQGLDSFTAGATEMAQIRKEDMAITGKLIKAANIKSLE